MATSVYASTEETTNACRACRVLLGPCTDELRDVLRHFIPPSTFPHVILHKRSYLPRLTTPQMNLILPRGSSYTGNYNDMDIPLLYILLRNICNTPPHSKGWGNDTDSTDRSLSANIERIRIARNQCVHSSSPTLSNADFNRIWSTVRSTVVDLDSFLNNGNQYEREVDFLGFETMDPVHDRLYVEELRKQAEEDAATREIVHGLKRKFEESETDRIENQNKMQKNIDEIKTPKSVIPPNVKDVHEKDFIKWKEEDEVYSETHNFHAMFDEVRKQPYMTFVGVPGSGKSATIHHIALILQQEGYEVVPIIDIRKIEDYCDSRNPQVFVIDDVVGVLGLQKQKLESLVDYEKRISNPSNIKTKLLMSCREAVFNECYRSFFLNEKNVTKMRSSENALNDDDKKAILQKHGLERDLLSPTLLKETSDMFPLLCKLYSKEKEFRNNAERFFTCPVPCILEEFNKMQCQNRLCYAAMVLCMLNDNKLSIKILKNTENNVICEMKSKVLDTCEVESYTDAFRFEKALSAMKGTYTKLNGSEYSFVHDSMFEIVAYHFGSQFPELILQFLSSNYIANNVRLQKCEETDFDNENKQVRENVVSRESKQEEEKVAFSAESSDGVELFDLCIRLKEDQYPMLAERLYKDIENMELYDVFMSNVLKEPKVCQAFIEVLMTKSYTEMKSVFLSVQKDVSKVVSKRERMKKESEERDERSREWRRQSVLLNESWIWKGIEGMEPTYSVRVISWVVFYGHNHVLQYILEQTNSKKETQSELFWIPFNPELSFATKQKENNIETDNATGDKCLLNFIASRNQDQDSNRQFSEKYRLLLFSCYSGDLKTVRIFLKYVDRNTINLVKQNFAGDHTPLRAACEGGNMSVVKELLEAGADVNLQGSDNTPLTVACEGGHMSVVKELLEAEADVNPKGIYNTPLTAACEGGHMSVVKELLEAGADVNPKGIYNTPLRAACEGGHMSAVKELLEAGADVNPQFIYNTPLTAACEGGHMSVVKELLEAGADVNPKDKYNTPLTAAFGGGHMSVVKELLEAGADVNPKGKSNTPLTAACGGGHMSAVIELIKAGTDVNLKGKSGTTPLTAACKRGHMIIVKKLLEEGADVNPQGKSNTPLTAACESGNMTIVKELLDAGADVNPHGKYNTPLTAACVGGNMSVVKKLLEAGADVNPHGKYNTPLTAACYGGHMSVVKELLEAGADVNLQGEYNTPLFAAYKGGHMSVMKELLEAGADVNQKDVYGTTPLTAACEGGHMSVVKELLEAGADVNPKGVYNTTPLTAACKRGDMNVVKVLLEAGADVNLKGKYDAPLAAACKGGYINVVKELLESGANVNLQGRDNTPLAAGCEGGHMSVVKELLEAGADVNLLGESGTTPLTAACGGGNMSVVMELIKMGADVNMQNFEGKTPLYNIVLRNTETLKPFVQMLSSVGADPTISDGEGLSALYIALVINNGDAVKQLLQNESKSQCNRLKLHLFDCLVDLRHSDVMADSKDDVVVTQRRVWRMKKWGDLYKTIRRSKCDVLKHLLGLGLDVNQWIQLYDD